MAGRVDGCRKPEILANAAHAILTRDSRAATGNFYIDDEVLAEAGMTDLSRYEAKPGTTLIPDIFID
jgi:citronellol/citronellal dehydrogenase